MTTSAEFLLDYTTFYSLISNVSKLYFDVFLRRWKRNLHNQCTITTLSTLSAFYDLLIHLTYYIRGFGLFKLCQPIQQVCMTIVRKFHFADNTCVLLVVTIVTLAVILLASLQPVNELQLNFWGDMKNHLMMRYGILSMWISMVRVYWVC